MNAATNPAADIRSTGEKSGEPSMEEILASIRRIIADEQAAAPVPAPAPIRAVSAVEPVPARNDNGFEAWLAQTAKVEPPETQHRYSQQTPAQEATPVHIYQPETPAHQPIQAEIVPLRQPEPHYEPAPQAATVQAAPVYAEPPAYQQQQTHYAPAQHYAEAAPVQPPRLSVVAPAASQEAYATHYEPAASQDEMHHEMNVPLRPGFEPENMLSELAGSSVQSSFQALARTMFMQNTGLVDEAVRDMLKPMLKQWLDDNLPVIVERLVRAEIERVARGGR